MKVEVENPVTGAKASGRISEEQVEVLRGLEQERLSPDRLNRYLDDLELAPGTRARIDEFRKVSVKVEGYSIQFGKRVLEIVVALQQEFPYATFGMIMGLVLSILITAIPVLGSIVGGVVTPVAVLAGVAAGLMADIKDKVIYKKISDAMARFDPLRPSFEDARQTLDGLYRVFVPQV